MNSPILVVATTYSNLVKVPFLSEDVVLERRNSDPVQHARDVCDGLWTLPITFTLRRSAEDDDEDVWYQVWPECECNALIAAEAAGKTVEEVRALVLELEAARGFCA